MNLEDLKLPFEENEIEWRIQSCGKQKDGKIWALVLAYVSARSVQDRLDKVCGPADWKVEYETLSKENLAPGIIGKLSIKIGDEWITKEDGADQTQTEPFKGGLSSAFKRAASAWGIGRYLYSLEVQYAKTSDDRLPGSIYANSKQKDGTYLKFYWIQPSLPAWALPKKDPSGNSENASKGDNKDGRSQMEPKGKPQAQKPGTISQPQMKRLFALTKESKWTNEQLKEYLKAKFKVESTKDIRWQDYDTICKTVQLVPFVQALKGGP